MSLRAVGILLLSAAMMPRAAAATCDAGPANPSGRAVYDLDQHAADWGVYCELTPTWVTQDVTSPSLDGHALRLALTGGDPYSNAHFYRTLTSDLTATMFSLSLSFWFTATTWNNEDAPSVVQALEFTTSKWQDGKRYEFALQWRNVGNGAGPGWRYWDPNQSEDRWVDLGITDRLAGEQWHTLVLQGQIVGGRVHYARFTIDQRSYSLDKTVAPALTPGESDRLGVAVQLDGNATEAPYSVYLDNVILARAWGSTCGDGRVDQILDALDDLSPWSVCCSDRDRAVVSLPSASGCSGQALAIDYDFRGPYPNGADWLIVLRSFTTPVDVSAFTHLRIALRGSNVNAHHNFQIKLADQANRVNWFVGESLTDLPAWRAIYVDLRTLTCFDNVTTPCAGRSALDLTRIARIEIGIGRCLREVNGVISECEAGSQETNVLSIDELAAVDLRPGAPHRLGSLTADSVPQNANVRAAAAAVLRDRQVLNGLAPAWYEEIPPDFTLNYNTYAQAVRILALVREYQLTRTDSYRQTAETAVTAMLALQRQDGTPNAGAWFTAYAWDGTRMVPRDGCTGAESATEDVDRCFWVGNTGWMLIALDHVRTGLPGDHTAVTAAIDLAGAWVAGKVGRLADAPDVITYGLEGNISAYFGLRASRRTAGAQSLGTAVFNRGWDSSEQRMKIGVLESDLGTAMDTAGSWGAQLLMSLAKEAEARTSQAYIASMYRVFSFDGTREGYGDVAGPWTMTVEFGAQGAAAGIPGAQHVMDEIVALQASDGSFPGSPDDFLGGGAWITRWHGVAPTAWAYFALTGSPLSDLYFTDDPIQPGVTPIRVVHITELRTRIDAVRAARSLAPYSWTDATMTAQTTTASAVHILELREALNAVYDAADRPRPLYDDSTLVQHVTPIRATHIAQLRDALKAIE
jgi:hypothetical protein